MKKKDITDKTLRSRVFHVLHRAGIANGRYTHATVERLDIMRLNAVSDEELLRQRGCGPIILAAIHRLRTNINDAIIQMK